MKVTAASWLGRAKKREENKAEFWIPTLEEGPTSLQISLAKRDDKA